MQPFDSDRLLAETFVEQVRCYDTVASTNDVALNHCGRPELRTPLLVVAGRQTAGRGRRNNRWWSAPGALTFSVALSPDTHRLAERDWPKASLTAGLAVCLALRGFEAGAPTTVKWPNDVFLEDRKVSGVLVEVGPGSSRPLVFGIGINVNNSFRDAPAELRSTAVSLADVTARRFDLTGVLVEVLRELDAQLNRLAAGDPSLAADWRQACRLRGQTISVDCGARTESGLCEGIDDDGALVLQTAEGTRRLYSGTVVAARGGGFPP